MKRFFPLMLFFIFSSSLFAQSEDTASAVKLRNTRTISLEEVYTIDSTHSIQESPILKSFEGMGIAPVKEAYKLNRLTVDSVLAADSLNPNFWRVYSYQAVNLFVQANKSPSMAMSIFLPWFLIFFFIVVIILAIKTLFIRPWMVDAIKPENDPNASLDEPADDNTEEDNEEVKSSENEGEAAGQIH